MRNDRSIFVISGLYKTVITTEDLSKLPRNDIASDVFVSQHGVSENNLFVFEDFIVCGIQNLCMIQCLVTPLITSSEKKFAEQNLLETTFNHVRNAQYYGRDAPMVTIAMLLKA